MKKASLFVLATFATSVLHAVSIQQLIDENKIPRIYGPRITRILDLSRLGIDNLEGLENIKGIETVHILRLASNNLTKLPSRAFAKATSLRGLGLANNNISTIEANAFAGLKNLWALVLNSNDIYSVTEDSFNELQNLRLLSIGDNPITAKRSYRTKLHLPSRGLVFDVPITGKNLLKAGKIGIAVAVLVLSVVGVYKVKEFAIEVGRERELTPQLSQKRDLFFHNYLSKGKIPQTELGRQNFKDQLEATSYWELLHGYYEPDWRQPLLGTMKKTFNQLSLKWHEDHRTRLNESNEEKTLARDVMIKLQKAKDFFKL